MITRKTGSARTAAHAGSWRRGDDRGDLSHLEGAGSEGRLEGRRGGDQLERPAGPDDLARDLDGERALESAGVIDARSGRAGVSVRGWPAQVASAGFAPRFRYFPS